VRLRTLAEPLLEAAHQSLAEACDRYVLAVHDWSQLKFRRHYSKLDRLPVPSDKPWKEGYDLHTVLLVGDRAGDPLAPISLSLHAADGVPCSRSAAVRPALSVLDEHDPAMTFVERQRFAKPVVHVIDAEADSVAHYRHWSTRPGRRYLVRADDRLGEYEGHQMRCSAIPERRREQGAFHFTREVLYHGRPAHQWVTEVSVRLTRPGQQNRPGKSRARVPGPPLELRLVISEVRTAQGQVLATWFLLANVPGEVEAATLALWYYGRWRVESHFKLLKSAGMDLEQWGQETAEAIVRRLLVASMACVVVWQLARSEHPQADEARRFLVQLSGRQMARGKRFTEPALLAGLWMFLTMIHTLDSYDLETLRRIANVVLPNPRAGPASELV
jgi:Transposase DDE domain